MKENQIYKCNVCGNVVELIEVGGGSLVCCGEKMELLVEKVEEIGTEKHRPIISGKNVKVGSIPHPMEENHYIVWIESIDENSTCRKNLKPGEKPEAEFCSESKKARAFCNVHGLWRTQI